jgi:Histone deacetylase domain
MKHTGFVCDESYFWHQTGNGALNLSAGGWIQEDIHAENPETKRRVKNLLERSKFIKQLQQIEPRSATPREIEMNHEQTYIERIKQLSETGGGDAGVRALVGPNSYEIALLSAGGVLTAVDAVMTEECRNWCKIFAQKVWYKPNFNFKLGCTSWERKRECFPYGS